MKITPHMVAAGSDEMAARAEDDPYDVCQDVLEAMLRAAGIHSPIERCPVEAVRAFRSIRAPQVPQRGRPPAPSSVSFLVDEMESVAIVQ